LLSGAGRGDPRDLGTKAEPVLPGTPLVVIDHHVPTGAPKAA
jgi:single-stranded-DNA-specific exonuclease